MARKDQRVGGKLPGTATNYLCSDSREFALSLIFFANYYILCISYCRTITFRRPDDAAKAAEELNGLEFSGRIIHARLDRSAMDPSNGVTVYVGNLPWHITDNNLLDMASYFHPLECNVLTNMYGRSRGYALMKFETNDQAQAFIDSMDKIEVDGRMIECRFDLGPKAGVDADSNSSLYVGNMFPAATDEMIVQVFAPFGNILDINIKRNSMNNSKGWG